MRFQTFYDWLTQEVQDARVVLLTTYEQRDRLLYRDAPKLRKRYMDQIGYAEEPVLQAELEVTLLRMKLQWIQAAINRREPINLEELEKKLEEEREKLLLGAEAEDKTLHELAELTEAEEKELEELYKQICAFLHPAVHPGMSSMQQELYERALKAYQNRDLAALKVVRDLYFEMKETPEGEIERSTELKSNEERRMAYGLLAAKLTSDYGLAKELYDCFEPLEPDAVVMDTLRQCNAEREKIEQEINSLRNSFPFNAEETLNDESLTQSYLTALRLRSQRAEAEKRELTQKVEQLLAEAGHD